MAVYEATFFRVKQLLKFNRNQAKTLPMIGIVQ